MPMLTYTARLAFSSNEERARVLEVLESQRLAFNECSKVKYSSVPRNSVVELHAAFYQNFRTCQPEIPSQVVICAEQDVLAAYRSVKSNKHVISSPVEKKKLSMRLDKRTFSYKNGVFSIITKERRAKCKPVLYPKLESLLNTYKFCDPLIFEKSSEVWIAITFDTGDRILPQNLACGIDLGVRVAAATSEGKIYRDKDCLARRRKIRHLKRSLQSRGTKSAKRKLRKVRRKERNASRDFTHRLTKYLILNTKADTLVVENLKGLKAGKRCKGATPQTPFAETRRILEYKAPVYGKTVIAVSPRFTSQIDSQTGKKEGERRGRRFYAKNGKVLDADVNAAINIATRSKLPVSITCLPNGETRNLDGQAEVMRPIVASPRLTRV